MRGAFIRTLVDLADRDPRILLLTGDLGFMAIEPFANRFPARFFNVGVAEQNMVGLATGLAESGFIPYVYSIATFATLRPYEFIRNGPVLHHLPVRIVGVGGGMEYGHNGPTHYGMEDVAIMRVQPGMHVIAPADHRQTVTALHATWNAEGPVYYRLGKDDQTVVPGLDGRFRLGRAELIGEGRDLLIVAMGAATVQAVTAAQILTAKGLRTSVLVVASVAPPPIDDLRSVLPAYSVVLTAEAHYVIGGVGSLVAEIVAEHRLPCRVVRCGLRTTLEGVSGGSGFLHERHGISGEALATTAERELEIERAARPTS